MAEKREKRTIAYIAETPKDFLFRVPVMNNEKRRILDAEGCIILQDEMGKPAYKIKNGRFKSKNLLTGKSYIFDVPIYSQKGMNMDMNMAMNFRPYLGRPEL